MSDEDERESTPGSLEAYSERKCLAFAAVIAYRYNQIDNCCKVC